MSVNGCTSRPTASGQRGTSLVEVLVALTLVAVTMLGLLGLQLRALSQQKDSFDRRNAAIIVSDFGERITANFDGYNALAYTALAFNSGAGDVVPGGPPACVTPTACTPVELAARDWWELRRDVAARLPGGAVFVATEANRAWATVVVGWIDARRTVETSVGPLAVDFVCGEQGIADLRYRCFVARVHP